MSCDGGLPAKIKGCAPPLTENQCQPPQTYFVWVCGELSTSWRIFFCQEFSEVVIQPWLVWHSLGRRWEDEFKMRIEDISTKIHYKSTLFFLEWWEDMLQVFSFHFHTSDENDSVSTTLLAAQQLLGCHPCLWGWPQRRRWCSTLWLSSSASGLWEESVPFPSRPRTGSPPSPSPIPSLVIQRIPSTLPLLLLALPPSGVAAVAVGQPGESEIVNRLPVTRLPRLVLHQPPRPRLHLLQPPQLLRVSGRQKGPTWTPSPSHQPTQRGRRRRRISPSLTSTLSTLLGGKRTTRTGVSTKPWGLPTKWEGLGSASFATLLVNQILVLPLGLMNHSWTTVKKPTLKPMSGLSDMWLFFRSWTEAWAHKISLETSNCLGLCDVYQEQLALLGFITLLEVYSAVLWFFFITFENKEMIPQNHVH